MHLIFLFITSFAFVVVVAVAPAAATTTHEKLWLNKELPIQERVDALPGAGMVRARPSHLHRIRPHVRCLHRRHGQHRAWAGS